MIISVHIPKTGGSTFTQLLKDNFGERLCLRYDQTPLRYRAENRPVPVIEIPESAACKVVHGHFVADKVRARLATTHCYAAWLRHPVERLLSHYYYWIREPFMDQPVCRRLIEERLSIEAFAAEPAMRNLQQFFLGSVGFDGLAFVGVTERFSESLSRFEEVFGVRVGPPECVNANPNKRGQNYRSALGSRTYEALEQLNAADMAIYHRALEQYR